MFLWGLLFFFRKKQEQEPNLQIKDSGASLTTTVLPERNTGDVSRNKPNSLEQDYDSDSDNDEDTGEGRTNSEDEAKSRELESSPD